ncbi:CheR family methyltransferase [Gemmatimonas groenlandica]|uniref:protein-glutamate O-methyltransferase n=1 Tax=Gemmatimonas groenlandica TaxID=2732249 RepID=A0A6M4IQP4_9BACT|nr:protein-glutamate O-methyltransferase CheR [Gemmatimonas groenlandica]QJR36465.1 protein-glutamate O-methyltransferase CheR [Gemmatimonas groenlandica]
MAMTAKTFDYIRQVVLTRSAIVLEPGKEYLVESRLVPLAKVHGFATLDDFADAMTKAPFGTMHRQMVEAMTTNETSFFRDIHPFDALRKTILPEIIARKAATKQLNIWCAAASSGQEPYSVAMLLREHFPELQSWKFSFIATDLSNAVLAKARSGRYGQLEVNRGLPAPLMVKYFTKDGTEWIIRDDIRGMIDFRELNLIEKWPQLPVADIVMIRNVLIYFDIATKKQILKNIRSMMSPQGYLMLGGAETTMGLDDQFERVQVEKGVAYRQIGATGAGRVNVAA